VLRVMRPAGFTPLSFPLVIERQSAHLTSESIQDRIRAMAAQWEGA
jgi:hypothetical protein